jgi:hypothetical protein
MEQRSSHGAAASSSALDVVPAVLGGEFFSAGGVTLNDLLFGVAVD